MNLTYFAQVNNGPLVELDEELAVTLYEVTCGGNRTDDMSDEEYTASVAKIAEPLFKTGAKTYVDEEKTMCVFGLELTEKGRFELILKHGTQTREEFAGWYGKNGH